MARMKDMYRAEIAPALMKQFNYKSVMQIPKLDKIVINVGVGDAKDNSKALDAVINPILKNPTPGGIIKLQKRSESHVLSKLPNL